MDEGEGGAQVGSFSSAEVTAIAHLYRGEVYRSTSWRSRLDNTTNWAVVTTGIALSLSFASPGATALPLILVGLLVAVFLMLEARRYRYFNVWRARTRLLETDFYTPLLRGHGAPLNGDWHELLANDLRRPRFHISFVRALGRRLRKNYCWLLGMQAVAYTGKLAIHPAPLQSMGGLIERAAIGPVPGWLVLLCGAGFHGGWLVFALVTWRIEIKNRLEKQTLIAIA